MSPTDAPSANDLFSAVERLDPIELESFTQRVLTLRARRMAGDRATRDAALVAKAGEEPPRTTVSRIRKLRERQDAERLTPAEHEELIALSDTLEEWNVRRLAALVELAQLRGTTLREVTEQLGLMRHDHGG